MMNETVDGQQPDSGLCDCCCHARVVRSDRGSRFVRCARAASDPTFPKYPALPVLQCAGFETLFRTGEVGT